MTLYFNQSGVWKSIRQPFVVPVANNSPRWLREGYANISGTWRRWFPNGTWSASANLPNGIRQGGSSNSESGFSATIFGGQNSFSTVVPLTYEFNGTSWSSGGSMTFSRRNNGGTGTAAAPLAYWGDNSPDTTEEYNASTNVWVAGGTLPGGTGVIFMGSGAGTQTSALAVGGQEFFSGLALETSWIYNGTAWNTTVSSLNFTGYNRSACGTQTAAIATCWGGGAQSTAPYNIGRRVTETWNGSTWTSQEAFGTFYNNSTERCSNTAGSSVSCTGTLTAALLTGNVNVSGVAYGEEFDASLTWSLTGALTTNRFSHYSAGGLGNNSLVIGGEGSGGSYLTSTERYTRVV
jgi:hypothetical protein